MFMTMSESEKLIDLEKENTNLHDALTQVLYQNQMLLNWVKGAVLTVDRDGLVQSANEIALTALGFKEEELSGCQYHETFHHTLEDGSEYPWEFCPVFAAIEDGSSHHVTGDVFWKADGSCFSVDYIVSPIRDKVNNISGATLIFRNLTEQRMQEANRIHGLKLESIGELSAGIAHEINTPIQFIGSNISFLSEAFLDLLTLINQYEKLKEIAKDNGVFPELIERIDAKEQETDLEYLKDEVSQAITQTSDGVERVSKLVLGLKGYAHSTEHSDKEEADLNEIIKNTLVVCSNAYKYVAELETELGSIPAVKVHCGDIGQVILNLIVNAAQAIEDFRGKSPEMGSIRVETATDDQHVIISVSDSGGGIPEGIKERIFDPFFTTKEVGRGSGQGLAIARSIIKDKHGGELTFQSSPGAGTTFYIKLPLKNN